MQPTQTLFLNLLVTLSLGLSDCQSTRLPIKTPTAKTVAAVPPSPNASRNTALALVATAPRILPASWSPDGNMLAYWTFTADEVKEDFKLPPGTLHYFDLHTRQSCIAPGQVGYGYFTNRLFWLATGQFFLVTVDHQVVFGEPCTGHFTKITALFPEPVDIIQPTWSLGAQ